jgi:hypothetical protein
LAQPVLSGVLFDLAGFRVYFVATNIALIAFFAILAVRSYEAQIIGLVVGAFC